MATEDIHLLQYRIRQEYDNLLVLRDEDTGLGLLPVFKNMESIVAYSDYRKPMRNPMSFDMLFEKLSSYNSIMQWVFDVALIAWNAMYYNQRDSLLFKYGTILEGYARNVMVPRLRSIYPNVAYPNLNILLNDNNQSALFTNQSTTTTPTPTPPPPQQQQQQPPHQQILSQPLQQIPLMTNSPSPVIIKQSFSSTNMLNNPMPQNIINNSNISSNININTNNNINNNDGTPKMYNTVINPAVISQNKALMQNIRFESSNNSSPSQSPYPIINNVRTNINRTHIKRGRPPAIEFPYIQRMKNITKQLKREMDPLTSKSIVAPFEKLPNQKMFPDYYNIIQNPITFDDIIKRIKTRKYKDLKEFQNDMRLMMMNFKTYHSNNLDLINQLALFDKNYQLLTEHELSKQDKDYIPEGDYRFPIEEIFWNNQRYTIGDWVLLTNPNQGAKPIVGQIFKLWSTSTGEQWLNACWYFRPEETVHRVDRLFYKNEVVKTGQYRDHRIQDLIGKCYVVHFTRFQRSDPVLDIKGPMFICEFRYNENDKIFNKIRTWRACLPEEIRDIEEKSIPVAGRKFFKYPSPIRNLLPPNATINDPIPEAQTGSVDAPPLVGAVFIGPQLRKDDLGEYSTSLTFPRYIIKPGDPHEDGKIDYETGTMIPTSSSLRVNSKTDIRQTNQPNQQKSLPISQQQAQYYNSNISSNASSTTSLTSMKQEQQSSYNLQNLNFQQSKFANKNITNGGKMANIPLQVNRVSIQNAANQNAVNLHNHSNSMVISQNNTNKITKQQWKSSLQYLNKNIPIDSRSLANKAYSSFLQYATTKGASIGRIVINKPHSYILTRANTKGEANVIKSDDINLIQSDHDKLIQRADKGNQYRRLSKDEFIKRKRRRYGEIIWFKGPSISICERMVNSGNIEKEIPLNGWTLLQEKIKQPKKIEDYEEIIEEETIMGPENPMAALLPDQSEPLIVNVDMDPMNTDNTIGTGSAATFTNNSIIPDKDSEFNSRDIQQELTTPALIGLRPSAKYLAYRLLKSQKSIG